MCLGDHVSQNALRALGTIVPRIPLASAHNSQEAVPQQTPKPLGDPAGKLGLSCPFLYWEHPPCVQSPRDISEVRVGGGKEFMFGQLRHGHSGGVCLTLLGGSLPTPSTAHGPAPCSVAQSFVHFTSCVAGALLPLSPAAAGRSICACAWTEASRQYTSLPRAPPCESQVRPRAKELQSIAQ